MNRVQRLLVFSIIVAVAAILVAAVRLATLGDDADSTPEQVESADSGSVDTADAADTTGAVPSAENDRVVRRVKIALVRGIPKGGPVKVRLRVGEELRLTVTSTGAEDTVIVNGYELSERVSPTEPARFKIVADQPGFFDVLMQTSGTKLADLDIVR